MKSFDRISMDYPAHGLDVSWKYVDKITPVKDPSFPSETEVILRGRTAIINVGSIKFSVQTNPFSPFLVFKEEHEENPSVADNVFEMWHWIKHKMSLPKEDAA